jgi:hypothetical protein
VEGVEFGTIGKDLDILRLFLIDEFVVVVEGKIGV